MSSPATRVSWDDDDSGYSPSFPKSSPPSGGAVPLLASTKGERAGVLGNRRTRKQEEMQRVEGDRRNTAPRHATSQGQQTLRWVLRLPGAPCRQGRFYVQRRRPRWSH